MSTRSLATFSDVATTLRFPLILCVLFIHAVSGEIHTLSLDELKQLPYILGTYSYVVEFGSHVFPLVAVPMFFFISGYYTFCRKDWTELHGITHEWKKKSKSLLRPYLIWNTLMIVSLLLLSWLTSLVGFEMSKPLRITSLSQLVGFYTYDVINYPLWYLRELIILTILSPLIIRLLRATNGWVLILFLLAFFWNISIIPEILGSVSLLFFSLGGFLGDRERNPLKYLWRIRLPLLVATGLTVFLLPFLNSYALYYTFQKIYILLGCSSALVVSNYVIQRSNKLTQLLNSLNKYVFFIYISHVVAINAFSTALILRLPYLNPGASGAVIGYFVTVAISLSLCVILYNLLGRFFPKVLAYLCGGRL